MLGMLFPSKNRPFWSARTSKPATISKKQEPACSELLSGKVLFPCEYFHAVAQHKPPRPKELNHRGHRGTQRGKSGRLRKTVPNNLKTTRGFYLILSIMFIHVNWARLLCGRCVLE